MKALRGSVTFRRNVLSAELESEVVPLIGIEILGMTKDLIN